MKKKFLAEHKGLIKKIGCLALVAVVAGTGLFAYRETTAPDVPELTTFVDPETAEVAEDEVPLAAGTKTTRSVKKKTTTKKVKTKTKAKKSKTTTKKTTKQTNKTKSTSKQTVKTNTKVATTIKTSVKKNSNVKTVKTTVVTTTTTTTTTKTAAAAAKTTAVQTTATAAAAGTYNIKNVAPLADARALNAFEKMGFKVVVNPGVSYSGCFNATTKSITLKTMNNVVYHELGHFVEFVGGTNAVKKMIADAYNSEKALYTAYNKAYVLQNSSEYFAESFKNYCENAGALKQSRPKTYEAIVQALGSITDARVNTIISVYSSVWK